MSDSLQLHGLQHARPPCPSPTPRVYSDSCALSWWCHPTISSSAIPFSSCLQSFPTSVSFKTSWFFALGGQSIGVSASTSALPMNIQDWFPLGLTGSPCSPRDSQEYSPTPQFKSINSSAFSFLLGFCHTSTWISHVPFLLNIPPTSHLPSHPILLGCHRTWVWAPWVIQHIPTGNLFYIW